MLRVRSRVETSSRPTFARGSVGTARVWDEATRAARRARQAAGLPSWLPDSPPPAHSPEERLAALVGAAVRSALGQHLADWSAEEHAPLALELQARILAWLAPDSPWVPEATSLSLDPPRSSPAPSGAPITGSIPGAVSAVAQPFAPPAALLPVGSESPLPQLLRAGLLQIGGTLAERPELCQRLIELALCAIEQAQPGTCAPPEADEQLDLLRRRLAKLEFALEDARAALLYVSKLEAYDPGIPSIYRAVQGLSERDPLWQCKRQALELLFQANLEHQQRAP